MKFGWIGKRCSAFINKEYFVVTKSGQVLRRRQQGQFVRAQLKVKAKRVIATSTIASTPALTSASASGSGAGPVYRTRRRAVNAIYVVHADLIQKERKQAVALEGECMVSSADLWRVIDVYRDVAVDHSIRELKTL